jgi:hypothetical protein
MAATPYRSAIPLLRDRCFSEYYDKTGQPTALLAKAQANLGIVAGGGMQTCDVTLTPAQIYGLYNNALQLLPQVTGKTYLFIGQILMRFHYIAPAYTGGGNVLLQQGFADATTELTPINQTFDSDNIVMPLSTGIAGFSSGGAVQVYNRTAAYATGNGTLRIVFNYSLF